VFHSASLAANGQRLRRHEDAGQDVHLVALDHLLGLAHAVGRVALRVVEDELDGSAQHAAPLLDLLGDQLARADH